MEKNLRNFQIFENFHEKSEGKKKMTKFFDELKIESMGRQSSENPINRVIRI